MEPGFYKNYFEVERDHWLMVGRRNIIYDMIAKYSLKIPEKMRVLDFGCGSGYFVSKLAETGYQSYGLDISSEAVQFGQRQGIKNLAVMNSHKLNFDDGYFDCILAMDVLEHLEDESWAIKEIERVLAPGGIAIIMTPAFMFLWGVQDEVSHHYRRYRMPQLLNVVQQSGKLDIVHKSYFNTLLFFPITAVRLISGWFNIKHRVSDFDINNRFLNKIFFSIFNAERRFLRHMTFPFGVSILAVFKKPGENINPHTR